jgi:haloalkane dehalogenase
LAQLRDLLACVDVGQGDPIVLLHGNPTSSYLWRNIIPYLQGLGHCIALDLIGMGDSAKLPRSGPTTYTFVEHRRYLVQPFTWDSFPQAMRPFFEALRSPAGEHMVLEQNMFVEQVLPGGMLRTLSDEEMMEYRRPFAEPGEGRRPTLTWPRQIPIDGEPADVVEIVRSYADWLPHSSVPKLFVKSEPGAILANGSAPLEFCRGWPAQSEVTVRGLHFLQEDSPDEIGRAVADWLRGLAER